MDTVQQTLPNFVTVTVTVTVTRCTLLLAPFNITIDTACPLPRQKAFYDSRDTTESNRVNIQLLRDAAEGIDVDRDRSQPLADLHIRALMEAIQSAGVRTQFPLA